MCEHYDSQNLRIGTEKDSSEKLKLSGGGVPQVNCREKEKNRNLEIETMRRRSDVGQRIFATYTCEEQLISRYNTFDSANLYVVMIHV